MRREEFETLRNSVLTSSGTLKSVLKAEFFKIILPILYYQMTVPLNRKLGCNLLNFGALQPNWLVVC